ncbi:MAG: HDOD domain-containing protein [Marinobacter sp.]|nr:HDOD domain-containing protein [Marinobacter sp.]
MQISPDTQLPSLPEVTLRALEACQQDDSYRHISDIISTDTALVARVLALANSALYGRPNEVRSLEQALLRLGTDRIRNLILTASLRQLLFDLGADQWQQLRDFWRHSLTTALMAKALATLTRYQSSDEAFMIGMVHNVGELIALKMAPEEQQAYLNQQADIGARLATLWGLGPMAADAIRYQQAPPGSIRDASHLVKLINLSTRLALADAAGIAAAGTVFSISEDLTREICLRINHEVSSLAQSLGVPLEADYDGEQASQDLRKQVIRQAMASQVLSQPPDHTSVSDLLAATVTNLTMLTGCPALFFNASGSMLRLTSASQGDCPGMTVATSPAQSVLTCSYQQQQPLSLAGRETSILDEQLLRLLVSPSLIAVPLVTDDTCHGVFVIGVETDDNGMAMDLARLFAARLSYLASRQQVAGRDQSGNIDSALAADLIRRQIHEISNPLTIIRQYIYQLRNRLSDESFQEELDIIREELERAGNLLVQMSEQHTVDEREAEADPATLNHEVQALYDLFEDGLFLDAGIRSTLSLCEESTLLSSGRAPVRQVIINLVRNAVESMPEGGELTVKTAAPVWQQGRQWIELLVEDNGPGIPGAIQNQLFQPVRSGKGVGHSGLGLSIVKQLVDDMEGIIGYRTGKTGTSFRVLLPAAAHTNDEVT